MLEEIEMRKPNLFVGAVILRVLLFSCTKDEGGMEKIIDMTIYSET